MLRPRRKYVVVRFFDPASGPRFRPGAYVVLGPVTSSRWNEDEMVRSLHSIGGSIRRTVTGPASRDASRTCRSVSSLFRRERDTPRRRALARSASAPRNCRPRFLRYPLGAVTARDGTPRAAHRATLPIANHTSVCVGEPCPRPCPPGARSRFRRCPFRRVRRRSVHASMRRADRRSSS